MSGQLRKTAVGTTSVSQQLADRLQEALRTHRQLEANTNASDKLLRESKAVIETLQQENTVLAQQLQLQRRGAGSPASARALTALVSPSREATSVVADVSHARLLQIATTDLGIANATISQLQTVSDNCT